MMEDEKYIRRCIQLARNGFCTTPPNPMVGAVIVYNGKIVGEGYHVHCGEGHAEVNAINSVKDKSVLKHSTIYVSLEPCSHYGKTPPCADLIIRMGIPRVVVGCIDPFSFVAGRGIQKLRDAGVEVTVGVLEQECRNLIRRFVVFNTQNRPYITLKWAQSSDGFIDVCRDGGTPQKMSTPISSLYVHKQRAEHKAILVGKNTALLDNPSLTVRGWSGAHPIRMVIDRDLSLPPTLHLFDEAEITWVFTSRQKESTPHLIYYTLDFSKDILPQICQTLYNQKVQSVLVEGGRELLQSFIDQGLWDEIFVEHARCLLHKGVCAPIIPAGIASSEELRDGVFVEHYWQ